MAKFSSVLILIIDISCQAHRIRLVHKPSKAKSFGEGSYDFSQSIEPWYEHGIKEERESRGSGYYLLNRNDVEINEKKNSKNIVKHELSALSRIIKYLQVASSRRKEDAAEPRQLQPLSRGRNPNHHSAYGKESKQHHHHFKQQNRHQHQHTENHKHESASNETHLYYNNHNHRHRHDHFHDHGKGSLPKKC